MKTARKFDTYDMELMSHWFKTGTDISSMADYFRYKRPEVTEDDIRETLEEMFKTKDLDNMRRMLMRYGNECSEALWTLTEELQAEPIEKDGEFYVEFMTSKGWDRTKIGRSSYSKLIGVLGVPDDEKE